MREVLKDSRVLAGWSGVVATPLALFTLWVFVSVSGGDPSRLVDAAHVLALPARAQALFADGMLADTLGYYLLPLILGGYLAARVDRGVIAVPLLTVYATLGVTGALLQAATLSPLSGLGGPAAAAAWTAVAHAAQKGLWWFEMLPFALFALIVGPALVRARAGFGWLLVTAGGLLLLYWIFTINRVATAVPALALAGEAAGFCALLVIAGWTFLSGAELLRQRTSFAS